jgi:acyl-CoA carboxylase subunit beta
MRLVIPFRSRKATPEFPDFDAPVPATCEDCQSPFENDRVFSQFRVCGSCGKHYAISPRRRLTYLVDQGSFRETDAELYSADPLGFDDGVAYVERLAEQRLQLQRADALVTGSARIEQYPVVVAVLDFSFMGGSMGVVVGEKLARAAELAAEKKWPLVTIVASGGARMQEGMLSLIQMAKTAGAIEQLKASGGFHISVLTHPTTGGVLASFASLGDLIVAEPESLIGFAGPRVVEQTVGSPLPSDSHTAEFQFAHGMVDEIVERTRQRNYLGEVLETILTSRHDHERSNVEAFRAAGRMESPWETVVAARADSRPTAADYIESMFDRFVELRGDRQGGDDSAIIAGLGQLSGSQVAVAAFERGHALTAERRRHGRPIPAGFRKVQRLLRLAARLDIPVLTLIDTPGAYPGIESEQTGLAGEIARTLELLSSLPTPVLAVVVGEGGSGGALAMASGDRILVQAGAFFSVIAPEGAATILYRDSARAPELAEKLRITATDLLGFGLIDRVVPEPPGGAAADFALASDHLKREIVIALDDLVRKRRGKLVRERRERYRKAGSAFVTTTPPKPKTAETAGPEPIPAD